MNAIARNMLAQNAVHGGFSSNRRVATQHEKLVRNTQKWVAQTFYGAMLKEMRKSPFRSEELEGGRGGEAFEEMFDQRIADHMSQSSASPLVNSIVHRIEAKNNPNSPRAILDATTAYARAMQHDKPKAERPGVREAPASHGGIPWGRGKDHPPRGAASPVKTHVKPATPIYGRRRQERILPELYHVAPTH